MGGHMDALTHQHGSWFERGIRPLLLALALLASISLSLSTAVVAAAHTHGKRHHGMRHRRHRLRHRTRHAVTARSTAPLVFGIYPGGAAGAVGPSGALYPEDPTKRLAAVEQLRAPGRPFVLHLYASYSGAGGWSAAQQVGQQIASYGAAGLQTELALTYRPSDGGSAADVAGFVSFVRATVRALGPDAGFVSLQVTNEANITAAPNAADGYYAGAKDALIQGVIAGKDESVRDGFTQLKIGFNWAYDTGSGERGFWSYLGQHGGASFVSALDWVGFDAYPGTWGPALDSSNLTTATVDFMDAALSSLRATYLPLAGIPHRVPLQVCENGYPTGPSRTEAMQVTVMKASVSAVDRARGTYNIAGYRWFDLRDADSSSSSFEDQYGIMRDDYRPKAGFWVYQQLVAALSVPH